MTDTEKLIQIRDARRMADWIEQWHPTFGDVHSLSTEGLVRTLRSLASALEAKQADTERLDWIEKQADELCEPDNGWPIEAVELEKWIEEDNEGDDVVVRQWEVIGHKIRGGYEQGQGATLREAIDDAMSPASLSTGNRENG